MATPAKFCGLNAVPDEELYELKEAIDNEINSRKKKIANEIEHTLAEKIKEILEAGFCVVIETHEDEIIIHPELAAQVRIQISIDDLISLDD